MSSLKECPFCGGSASIRTEWDEDMTKYKKGDVLDALSSGEIDILLHVVNCKGVMGAGIAKQIKTRYPVVFNKYAKVCFEIGNPLGMYQGVVVTDGKGVINLFAQDGYGRDKRQLDYGALAVSLYKASDDMQELDHEPKLGIPYGMGCGLAGGDWSIVSEIIEFTLRGLDVTIYSLD